MANNETMIRVEKMHITALEAATRHLKAARDLLCIGQKDDLASSAGSLWAKVEDAHHKLKRRGEYHGVTVLTLEWKDDADRPGEITALALNGTYRIALKPNVLMGGSDGYQVTFAGYPIGSASYLDSAKTVALLHLNR